MVSMIKAIIFDADGMVIKKGLRFSDYLEKDSGISNEITKDFFDNEFQKCLIGRADLKEELAKHIEKWGWTRSLEDLLDYWFSVENRADSDLISLIQILRKKGILCYLATNQEKYRTEYLKNVMGFTREFDEIFSSAYIGYKKPQSEFFEYVLKSLPANLEKNEVSYWDDDEKHVEAAQQFGFQANFYTNLEDFREKVLK